MKIQSSIMKIINIIIDMNIMIIEEMNIEIIKKEKNITKIIIKNVKISTKKQNLNLIQISIIYIIRNKIMIYTITESLFVKEKS